MKSIAIEYDAASTLPRDWRFYSREQKKSREWWVLGSARNLLKEANLPHPEWAVASEEPDFRTFDAAGEPWAEIEVVEVMHSDREREKEYRRKFDPERLREVASWGAYELRFAPVPWVSFRHNIYKKAKKKYAAHSVLLVYFNIQLPPDVSLYSSVVEELEKSALPSLLVFQRVLLLNCVGSELIEISPATRVLFERPRDPLDGWNPPEEHATAP